MYEWHLFIIKNLKLLKQTNLNVYSLCKNQMNLMPDEDQLVICLWWF